MAGVRKQKAKKLMAKAQESNSRTRKGRNKALVSRTDKPKTKGANARSQGRKSVLG